MQKKKFEKNNENDINVDENEIKFYKDIPQQHEILFNTVELYKKNILIKNTKGASQNIKNIKNNNIKKLLLFRDIFK